MSVVVARVILFSFTLSLTPGSSPDISQPVAASDPWNRKGRQEREGEGWLPALADLPVQGRRPARETGSMESGRSRDHGGLFPQEKSGKDVMQSLTQFEPADNLIDQPALQQELRRLKTGRQRLLGRVLDDACTGKANQRAGLGENHIAERCEASRHSAHRGMG